MDGRKHTNACQIDKSQQQSNISRWENYWRSCRKSLNSTQFPSLTYNSISGEKTKQNDQFIVKIA